MINKSVLDVTFISSIRELIRAARSAVARNIDTIQVLVSFEIGFRIVEREQQGEKRAEYGKRIISELSSHLSREFGKGFSGRNLRNMRKFYLTYKIRYKQIRQKPSAKLRKRNKEVAIWQKPSAEFESPFKLSWSQYVFLCGINDKNEREFYEIEPTFNNWTLSELRRQFNTGLYERLALSRNKEEILNLSRQGHVINQPSDLSKEPYILEFLGLDEKYHYSESDLETAIIDKLEHFLLELGKGFLFEARQKRFTFDEEHFFVDLVFYNRILRCYVIIDLKIGKLTH